VSSEKSRAENVPGDAHGRVPALRIAATLAFVSLAGIASAETPVYKCAQPGGPVLYADFPCKGGAIVDIRPGEADPAAIQRLERARVEFDRAAAVRKAGEEAAAIRGAALNQRRLEAEAEQRAAGYASTPEPVYAPAYGFIVPSVKRRPDRRTPHRHEAHRRATTRGSAVAIRRER
jgi:hypothetical protein